jgi:hypothetical protein
VGDAVAAASVQTCAIGFMSATAARMFLLMLWELNALCWKIGHYTSLMVLRESNQFRKLVYNTFDLKF